MLQTENSISSHKGFLCLCCISAQNYTTRYFKLKQIEFKVSPVQQANKQRGHWTASFIACITLELEHRRKRKKSMLAKSSRGSINTFTSFLLCLLPTILSQSPSTNILWFWLLSLQSTPHSKASGLELQTQILYCKILQLFQHLQQWTEVLVNKNATMFKRA